MRHLLIVFLLLGLAACGDPLAGIEKLENVELADEKPVAQALPDTDELEPQAGLLSALVPADDPDATDTTTTVLTGAPTKAADAEPEARGLRGWLRRAAKNAETETGVTEKQTALSSEIEADQITDVAVAAPAPAETAESPVLETASLNQADAKTVAVPNTQVEPKKRKGLFGLIKAADARDAKDDAADEVKVASLDLTPADADAPQAVAAPTPKAEVEPKKRRGIFASVSASAPRNGPDAKDVEFGAVLPYGEVARVCDAKGKNLGRKVEKSPARGKGYALYDPFPHSTAPRTFYLTGFQDGCPRQFTAALALLGSPTLHEQLRYGRPSGEYPYSNTDKAYEKIKSSVCRVGKRKPCGAKISEMEKSTIFVTTYERFGNNARWADMLVHDGTVLAASIKKQ